MAEKTRKAQVVIAAADHEQKSFSILLLQTNEKRGSFWQNVTGKIEENETYEEGALRETIEETKLNVEDIVEMLDLKLSHDFIDERKRDVHEKSFLLVMEKSWKVIIDPKEHQNYKWVSMDKIDRDCVKHEGNFEALQKSLKLLRQWGF